MLVPNVLEMPSDATGIATGVVLFVAVVMCYQLRRKTTPF